MEVANRKRTHESNNAMRSLLDNLKFVYLPSPSWSFHVDSQQKFLAFSVMQKQDSSQIGKSAIVFETKDGVIKIDAFVNNMAVDAARLIERIHNVKDLNAFLKAFDELRFCKFYLNDKRSDCTKFSVPTTDLCNSCSKLNTYAETSENSDNKVLHKNKLKIIEEEENHQCSICNKIFENAQKLSHHENKHLLKNSEGKFFCTICSKTFDDTFNIITHYKMYHIIVKFIKCSACTKQFSNIPSLKRHIRDHPGYEEFPCSRCKEVFISKHKLRAHVCKRSVEKSKLYMCESCNTSYKTNHLLQQHKKEHEIRISLTCSACDKTFKNTEEVLQHKLTCKKRILQYCCDVCNKKFSCISQKLHHLQESHEIM